MTMPRQFLTAPLPLAALFLAGATPAAARPEVSQDRAAAAPAAEEPTRILDRAAARRLLGNRG